MKLARRLPYGAAVLFALTTSAVSQGAAEHFTAGVIIADHQVRYEGLHDVNGDGILDAIGWWWVDSEIRDIRASVTLYDGEGGILSHSTERSQDIGSHTNRDGNSGSCLGDFDGDGQIEQLVAIYDTYIHMEFPPDGSIDYLGTFANPHPHHGGPWWGYMNFVTADFTGDGVDDFVMANTEWLELWSFPGGVPTLLDTVRHYDTVHTTIDVGEFNGDGIPDVVMSYVDFPNNSVRTYSIVNGAFSAPTLYTLDGKGGPIDVSVGDVDNDGDDDIVVFGPNWDLASTPYWMESLHLLRQTAPGVFDVGPRVTGSGPATALADIDGDGDLDGICCGGGTGTYDLFNDEPSTFMVCLNDGTGAFGPSSPFPGLGAQHIAGAMDFDGDGDIDLIGGRCVLLNTQALGALGCVGAPNSTGAGAVLNGTGSASISRDDLVLTTRNLPIGTAALTFFGTDRAMLPLGNGTRCVGGQLVRLPIQLASAEGTIAVPFDRMGFPGYQVMPGAALRFQTWYRDVGVGQHSNVSSSGRIVFMP